MVSTYLSALQVTDGETNLAVLIVDTTLHLLNLKLMNPPRQEIHMLILFSL